MKNIFSQFLETRHSTPTDLALLILRLAVGVWMLTKGLPKIGMLLTGPNTFPAVLGMSSDMSLGLTLFAQVICSILIMVGAATRFAGIVLVINMLVAVVVAHSADPFVMTEPALHFLLLYVVLLLAGAGKFSLDYLVSARVNLFTNLHSSVQNGTNTGKDWTQLRKSTGLLILLAMVMLSACGTTSVATRVNGSGMLVRMSEIEIFPDSLRAYKTILNEEAEASVRLEPGVISIFPMYQKEDSTQIRILEIYADTEAYQSHLKTPHFQKYKTTTLSMVKELRLIDMNALDPETMSKIFSKLKD